MTARYGRYEVLGELGRGGMGAVFRARDHATGREVALKTLLRGGDATALARFQREARALAALDHPGVVKVHDAGEAGGRPFLVCELVPGARPLDRAAVGLPLERRAALVRDACRALGHAHARGVVHRDVKAENILVDDAGRVRVTDFGLAVLSDAERLTRTGVIVGTPSTMAPEQLDGRGAGVTPATDVWALGVVLYQALTGRLPFDAQSLPELCGAILAARPTPPRRLNPEVSRPLEAVCLRALSRAPRDRWKDGDAMADALEAALRGERVAGARSRRRSPVAVVVTVVLLVGAAAAALVAGRPPAPEPTTTTPAAGAGRSAALSGALRAVHGDKARTRLGWVTVEATVEGERVGARVSVNGRLAADLGGAPVWSGRVPLVLGRNTVRLEAQRKADGQWVPLGELTAVRDERFDPPPPAEVVDLRGRPLVLDEEREVYLAHDGSVLLYVPPARFVRGSDECMIDSVSIDLSGDNSVRVSAPVHQVTLTRGFLIGRDEVTWAQVERWTEAETVEVMKRPQGWADDHPATDLTWHEVRAYTAWAGLDLPTEAQWELAARGTDARPYPWGSDPPTPELAVVPVPGYVPEGPRRVSEPLPGGESWVGARHMAGNVREWTLDQFIATYDQQLLFADGHMVDPCYLPMSFDEAPAGAERTVRGGSWRTPAAHAHCAHRNYSAGDLRTSSGERANRRYDTGFRVALTLPPP